MKKTFIMEIEKNKTAYRSCKYCPNCNCNIYSIYHLLNDETEIENWWVECSRCGYEGPGAPERDIAIARWEQMNKEKFMKE